MTEITNKPGEGMRWSLSFNYDKLNFILQTCKTVIIYLSLALLT